MKQQEKDFKCSICEEEKNILFEAINDGRICSTCLEKSKLGDFFKTEQNPNKEEKITEIFHSNKNKLKDYQEILKDAVGENQMYEGILKYLPDFYMLISNINSSPKCEWYTKMLVNSALSYLVLEEDLIPDYIENEGYLDDLFICAYVLKEIRNKFSQKIILENLKDLPYNEDILKIISFVFEKSSFYLGDKTKKILDYVGLSKFTMFDVVYFLEESHHLKKQKEKQKIVYAMLAIKTKKILENVSLENQEKKITHLQDYIRDHPDFSEINRYMEFLKND